jgi:predicted RNA-binding protein with PIN domain
MPVVRVGEGRRGGGRDPAGRAGCAGRAGPTRTGKVDRLTAADGLLRPALEAAVAVARAGEDAVPARPAPPALRPFLQFARLPARALVAARRVIDADEAFRERVVEEVSEHEVGRAGWIFLSRPPGWEEELDELSRAATEAEAEEAERRAEGDARRRLGIAEETARRAEEAAADARAEAARAAEALADQRRARRAADRRVTELSASLAALTADRDQARAEAAAAAAATAAAQRRAEQARAEAEALRRAPPPPPPPPVVAPEPPPPVAVTDDAAGFPDSEAAGEALATAARAARELAAGLEAAAVAFGVAPPEATDDDAGIPARGGAGTPTAGPHLRPVRPPRPPARAPLPLPPGILEDSPEAAAHLVRRRGVVLLVDGYNVSQAGWPDLPIAEQRRRLVDALGELSARTGADVRVVFDGSDVGPAPVATTAQAVRVRFSPPGTEADDVIVAEVAEIPRGRPVVVVSSDRRVRDGSRARGANLLRSSQLLGLLR